MRPCELGFPCPHRVFGEEDVLCIHPYVLSNCPRDMGFSTVEDITCPLDYDGTDFGYLLELASEYDTSEWKEVISRLSVHLGRSYDHYRYRMRERAACLVWREYYRNRSEGSL